MASDPLKPFRATFGRNALDGGAPLDPISVSMLHRTTATTERFYAQVKTQKAFEEVRAGLAQVLKPHG